jgi:hypothetical protein
VFGGDGIFQEILPVICGDEAFQFLALSAQQCSSEGSEIFCSSEDSDASGTLILLPSDPFSVEKIARIFSDAMIA